VSDAVVLFRDMAGDAAQKAADKVNPSDDRLAQIDQPAEDNTWHDKPDLSRDNIKSQLQSRMPIGQKDVQDTAQKATQQADPHGSTDPVDTANKAAADQQQGGASGVDAVSGAKVGAQDLKNKIDEGTDDEKKERARQYRERTANYFKSKMPRDRREQIVFRLKKMIVEIQGHQDCKFIARDG
jgi:hypothetical protein